MTNGDGDELIPRALRAPHDWGWWVGTAAVVGVPALIALAVGWGDRTGVFLGVVIGCGFLVTGVVRARRPPNSITLDAEGFTVFWWPARPLRVTWAEAGGFRVAERGKHHYVVFGDPAFLGRHRVTVVLRNEMLLGGRAVLPPFVDMLECDDLAALMNRYYAAYGQGAPSNDPAGT